MQNKLQSSIDNYKTRNEELNEKINDLNEEIKEMIKKAILGKDDSVFAPEENLPVRVKKVKLLLPFDKGGLASDIRRNCTLISEEYTAEGIEVVAIVDEQYWHKVRDYAQED